MKGVRPHKGGIEMRYCISGVRRSKFFNKPPTEENLREVAEQRERIVSLAKDGISVHCKTWHGAKIIDLEASFAKLFQSARKRPNYHLTEDDEKYLVDRCAGACELTGTPFSAERYGAHKAPFAPSIDRIDSSKGYTRENCRIISVAANFAMNEWGEEVLRKLAIDYVKNTALKSFGGAFDGN